LVAIEQNRADALRDLDCMAGFKAPLDEYIRIVEEAMTHPYDLVFMPRAYIEAHLFKHTSYLTRRCALCF
jgi:hypothetical protein